MTAAAEHEEPEPVPDWWAPYAPGFPDWHVWGGVNNLVYGRRPRSSPQPVERAANPGALVAAIERRERLHVVTGSYFSHLRPQNGDTGSAPAGRPAGGAHLSPPGTRRAGRFPSR